MTHLLPVANAVDIFGPAHPALVFVTGMAVATPQQSPASVLNMESVLRHGHGEVEY